MQDTTSKAWVTGHLMGWDMGAAWDGMARGAKRALLAKLGRMDESAHNALVKGVWNGLSVYSDALYTVGRTSRLARVVERLL